MPKDNATQNYEALKDFDTVDMAERITGQAITADPSDATMLMAFGMQVAASEARKEALLAMGDTTFSNEVPRYLEIAHSIGFEDALQLTFQPEGESYDTADRAPETFYVLVQRELGIVLAFDTSGGNSVNSSHIYYCWRADSPEKRRAAGNGNWWTADFDDWRAKRVYNWQYMPDDLVWCGAQDAREALVYNINQLKANGKFYSHWPHTAFTRSLNLLHFQDWKNVAVAGYLSGICQSITYERIKLLPQWAQDIIFGSL